ncbi:MAG: trypsin-like peptidase domain-containing protein, partial [Desulfobacterales bacterium]|nr:trypsin-like peptidase domain-containing protein [Desulfobacterales bacterium]
ISAEYEVRERRRPFQGFALDPFFDSFFKDFFDRGSERRQKRSSLGSGVIIDGQRGFILTNAHVIVKTDAVTVTLQDGRELQAQVVGADAESDLAVLRVDAQDPLPSVAMGSSDDLMIGETVIAIGNPFGFSHTVTTGVISARNRSIKTEDMIFHDFIQIDASINPGNSGGPLLNINGELIGINTAIYAKAQGIGFAIPIHKARRIVADLIAHGEVIVPWIGLVVQDLDAKLAQYLALPDNHGVLIQSVDPGSPAAKAGVHDGDVLLAIGEEDISSQTDYLRVLKGHAVGETLTLKLWRNARETDLSLKAAFFPLEQAGALAYRLLGIQVKALPPVRGLGKSSAPAEGVVIDRVRPQSYLARIGVQPGDILRRLDGTVITDLKGFESAIIRFRYKPSVALLLQRGEKLYNISVKF